MRSQTQPPHPDLEIPLKNSFWQAVVNKAMGRAVLVVAGVTTLKTVRLPNNLGWPLPQEYPGPSL